MKRFVTFIQIRSAVPYYFTIYGEHDLASKPYFTSNAEESYLRTSPIELALDSVRESIAYYDNLPHYWKRVDNVYVDETWKLCQVEVKSDSPHKCNCPSRTLLLSGCKCGGI